MPKATISTEALDAALKLVGDAIGVPGMSGVIHALYQAIENTEERSFTAGYKQGYQDSEADKKFAVHMEANFGTSEPIVGFAGETIDDDDLRVAAAALDDSVTVDRVNAQVEGGSFAEMEYLPLPKNLADKIEVDAADALATVQFVPNKERDNTCPGCGQEDCQF